MWNENHIAPSKHALISVIFFSPDARRICSQYSMVMLLHSKSEPSLLMEKMGWSLSAFASDILSPPLKKKLTEFYNSINYHSYYHKVKYRIQMKKKREEYISFIISCELEKGYWYFFYQVFFSHKYIVILLFNYCYMEVTILT